MAQKKVHVAIIGVGNCASLLLQGVQFYKDAVDVEDFIEGDRKEQERMRRQLNCRLIL